MTTEHSDENRTQAEETHQLKPASALPDGRPALMTTMASVMPWVISLFFHAGVMVILAFITIVLLKPPTPVIATVGPRVKISPKFREKIKITSPKKKLSDRTKKAEWRTRRDRIIPLANLGRKKDKEIIGVRGLNWRSKGLPNGWRRGKGIFYGLGPPSGPWPDDDDDDDDDEPGNAYHIVYVVDCSGSMLDTFDDVRRELMRSIGRLHPKEQTFHVIFFSSGKLRENPPRRLVYASDANRLAALKFLKTVTPEKRTDPVPALKRAFEVLNRAPNNKKGKLLFLLTDGEFLDNEKVFGVIKTMNAVRSIQINTILHHHRSPEAIKTLRRIANENGGDFRFVEAGE